MIKSMIKLVLGFALLLWSQGAYAAKEGLYMGLNGSYETYNNKIAVDGGETNISVPLNPKGVATGFFIGFRENAGRFNMALETRYEYSFASDTLDPDISIVDQYKFRGGHSFGIALLPGYQITDSLSLYTRFGYVSSQYEEKITEGLLETTYKNYRGGFEYGAGFQIDLQRNMSIRVEYTRTNYKNFVFSPDTGASLNVNRNRLLLGILINL